MRMSIERRNDRWALTQSTESVQQKTGKRFVVNYAKNYFFHRINYIILRLNISIHCKMSQNEMFFFSF
jgi:hypothetical protein